MDRGAILRVDIGITVWALPNCLNKIHVLLAYKNYRSSYQEPGMQLHFCRLASRFAPGEALPPGYQITAHPEGVMEPQVLLVIKVAN